jgi:hypothetical protein
MGKVQVAILAGALYTLLRDAVFTHPTMSESLGMLFARVPKRLHWRSRVSFFVRGRQFLFVRIDHEHGQQLSGFGLARILIKSVPITRKLGEVLSGAINELRPRRAKALLLRHRRHRRKTSLCSVDDKTAGCRFRNIPGLAALRRLPSRN